MKKTFSYKLNIVLFLLPALLLFVSVLIAPIFLSIYYSFCNKKGAGGAETWIWFANYQELFNSSSIGFWKALGNSLLLALFSVGIQLPLALILALKLGKGVRGERGFLSIYFMPVLISTVVIGQLWLKIYNPDYGILNQFLRLIGLGDWLNGKIGVWGTRAAWLSKTNPLALAACFVPILWQYVGYHMLLMYAGVKSVPKDLLEAAQLDGCTEGQVNRFIIIPYIKPILKVSVIFAVTGSLKSFDLIYVLMGSDKNPCDVPSTLMIRMLFSAKRYGMGSTIAVMLILLCFAFALLINIIFKDKEVH